MSKRRIQSASSKRMSGDLPATLDDFLNESESSSNSDSDQENSHKSLNKNKTRLDLSARRQDIQKRIEALRERRRMASNQSSTSAFGSSSKENLAPNPKKGDHFHTRRNDFDEKDASSEEDDKSMEKTDASGISSWLKPAPQETTKDTLQTRPGFNNDDEDKQKAPSTSQSFPRSLIDAENPFQLQRRTFHIQDIVTDEDIPSKVAEEPKSVPEEEVNEVLEDAIVEIDLDTTEQDKKRFFEALEGIQNAQGQPLDFGELNKMLGSDDEDMTSLNAATEKEDLDTILEKAKQTWISEIVDSEHEKRATPDIDNHQIAHLPGNREIQPTQAPVSAVETSAQLGEDSYSMSFDSVSDLQDVSMSLALRDQSIMSDTVSAHLYVEPPHNDEDLSHLTKPTVLNTAALQISNLSSQSPPGRDLELDQKRGIIENDGHVNLNGDPVESQTLRLENVASKPKAVSPNPLDSVSPKPLVKHDDPQSHVSTPVPDFKDYFPSELSEISSRKDSHHEANKPSPPSKNEQEKPVHEVDPSISHETNSLARNHEKVPLNQPDPLNVNSNAPPSFGTSHLTFDDFLALHKDTSLNLPETTSHRPSTAPTPATKKASKSISASTRKTETLKRVNQKVATKTQFEPEKKQQDKKKTTVGPSRKSQIPTPTGKKSTTSKRTSGAERGDVNSNIPPKATSLQVKIPTVSKESAIVSSGEFQEYEKMSRGPPASECNYATSATTIIQTSSTAQFPPSMPHALVSENEKLKEQLKALQATLSTLERDLSEKTVLLENTSEQIRFLEKQVENERETKIRLQTTPSQRIIRSGTASDAQESQLLKDLAEQETIIRGYQTENEKLIAQLKSLRGQMKEQEQKHFFKEEALQREISQLRSQLELGGHEKQERGSDFSLAKYSVRIEQLESELASQKRQQQTRESDLKLKISQLDAQLTDANNQLATLQDSNPDHLRRLESEKKQLQDKYDGYIVELEGRLELLLEQQNYTMECQTALAKYQERIQSLEDFLQEFETSKMKSNDTSGGKQQRTASNRKSSAKESMPLIDSKMKQFLRDMSQKIASLQSVRIPSQFGIKTTSSYPVSLTTSHSRPPIEENDYIRHLKHRIKKLEADIIRIKSEKESILQQSQETTKELKVKAEEDLEKFRASLQSSKHFADVTQVQISKDAEWQIKQLQLEINDLRRQNEALVQSASSQVNGAISTSATHEKSFAVMQRRQLELEKLIDEYHNRLQSVSEAKEKVERDLTKQLEEKSELIQKYEEKILTMQREVCDKIFAVEESKYLDQIHQLKMELDTARSELNDASNKLQISESTRQAVHETTITILRQAQEESARLALAQHEKALEMLRSELGAGSRNDPKNSSSDERIVQRLEKRIEELEESNLNYQLQVQDSQNVHRRLMEAESAMHRLRKENEQLSQSLELGKSGWPPALHHFDRLMKRIEQIEEMESQRAACISQLLSEPSSWAQQEIRREREKWIRILKSKDTEIAKFQEELTGVMRGIQKLKSKQSSTFSQRPQQHVPTDVYSSQHKSSFHGMVPQLDITTAAGFSRQF